MRVGFDETDAQAVVYYGRYFPYFDRARVEYLRHLGLLRDAAPAGSSSSCAASVCEYEAPARFDDPLEVFIRTARIGRTSETLEFRAGNAPSGTLLAVAEEDAGADRRRHPAAGGGARTPSGRRFERSRTRHEPLAATGRSGAVEAIERILNREGEADEILRAAVVALHERISDARGVAVAFVEDGELVPGPIAGATIASRRPIVAVPVLYERRPVAELWIEPTVSPTRPTRRSSRGSSDLLSPYCLVGWDTGGEAWEP